MEFEVFGRGFGGSWRWAGDKMWAKPMKTKDLAVVPPRAISFGELFKKMVCKLLILKG
jgi:hypothetical protein